MEFQTTEEMLSHYDEVAIRLGRKRRHLNVVRLQPEEPPFVETKKDEVRLGPTPEEFWRGMIVNCSPRDKHHARQMARHVAAKYGAKVEDVFSKSRKYICTEARKELYWWLFRRFQWSLFQIGTFLHRDHSTVIHGVQYYDGKRIDAGKLP